MQEKEVPHVHKNCAGCLWHWPSLTPGEDGVYRVKEKMYIDADVRNGRWDGDQRCTECGKLCNAMDTDPARSVTNPIGGMHARLQDTIWPV